MMRSKFTTYPQLTFLCSCSAAVTAMAASLAAAEGLPLTWGILVPLDPLACSKQHGPAGQVTKQAGMAVMDMSYLLLES